MCGICGICNSKNAELDIRYMMQSIRHRGPDGGGEYIDKSNNVSLGHRRLSILDLSDAGRQPMVSDNKRYVIAFNGEIYNHSELKELLPQEIVNRLKSTTDTEVLLELFAALGIEETLHNVRGMFAIALYDLKEKTIYLMRDRAGEKPLYYGFLDNKFVFASELKAINEIAYKNNIKLTLDYNAIGMFLKHSYIPAPYSIYQEIWKVEAAEIIKIKAPFEAIEKKWKYWRLEEHIEECTLSRENAKKELANLLASTVSEQMIVDVPYGAFLSGGIDSSLVVSYMQKNSRQKIKTFSIGFETDSYNEAPYAKKVAKHIDCDHQELYVTDIEAMDVIPHIPEIYDEPYADSSQIPTYLVSKLAKEKVSVVLTGDAGDELFCGYEHYKTIDNYYQKIGKLPGFARNTLGKVAGCKVFEPINQRTFNNKIDKFSRILQTPDSTEFYYEMLLVDTTRNSLIPDRNAKEYFTNIKSRLPYQDFVSNMQFIDFNTYLQNDILVKVDRAAMNNSLETRVPFLDKRIVEFAYSLPMKYKYNDLGSKAILRELLYDEIPKELLERPKKGFGIPLDDWLRGPLKEWAEELLDAEELKKLPGFDYEQAMNIWRKHVTKLGNYKSILWNILMLSQWLQMNSKFYLS